MTDKEKTRGLWVWESTNRKRDGTLFTTRARITTLEISGETCWISSQEDITDRQQEDEKLYDSLSHLSATLDSTTEMGRSLE
jgi:PAS domain-containing protein